MGRFDRADGKESVVNGYSLVLDVELYEHTYVP
jgi:hypothetical protein